MILRKTLFALASLAILGLGMHSAQASTTTVTVTGPGNAGNGNQPIAATAVFTFTAGHLTLSLTNDTNNPISVGSLLVGIAFSITGGGSASTPVQSGASGTLINISDAGAPSAYGGNATTELALWAITSGPAPDVFKLTNGNDPGIIGYGNGGLSTSTYSAANSSITGNSHQPYIQHTGIFDFNITGLTTESNVSAVQFMFNTNFTSFESTGTTRDPDGGGGVGNSTPLPAAVWGGAALIAGLGLMHGRKRRKVS